MKHYLQILTWILIGTSCSNSQTENQNIGTPDLTELIYSEIEYLDKEHKILFLWDDNSSDNLEKLKADLGQLIDYDIDSMELVKFKQSTSDCDGLLKKIWNNENYTLTISTFKTTVEKNEIELIKVEIVSNKEKVELLTVSGGPLEYLKINDKKHNPTYESRMVGLDEAIRILKEKNCR